MVDQLLPDVVPTRPPVVRDVEKRDAQPTRRVLILTAEIGAGHTSTAQALKRQLEREDQTAKIDFAEPIKDVPSFARLPRLYRFMTAYMPIIWALFYYSRKLKLVRSLYGRFIRHRLQSAISRLRLEEYDTVVITYSMYCNCIDSFTQARVRTIVLVTDLFGGPHEWFSPGADRYIVPTEQMAEMAEACNIDSERVWLRRLPTLASDIKPRAMWSAGTALRILIIGGSEGHGPLKAAASGLLRGRRKVSVTVVCGNNTRLERRLRRSSAFAKGYVEEVATTYQDYDIVVTKPGSVTVMELLQQKVPFVLLPGIPGIEAGNTRLFRRTCTPRIRGFRAACLMPQRLVNRDLSLSSGGAKWVSALSELRDSLPTDYVSIDEIAPVYRVIKLSA